MEILLKSLIVMPSMQDLLLKHVYFFFVHIKYLELVFWKYLCGLILLFYMAVVHTMIISIIVTFQ